MKFIYLYIPCTAAGMLVVKKKLEHVSSKKNAGPTDHV